MTRILETGLAAAVARRGTEPGWLILVEALGGDLRYSTRGTLSYGGYTWTGGAVLRGVEFSGDLGASVTLELPNTDNSASALALSDLLRDSEVTLYAYHGDTGYETELLSDNSAVDQWDVLFGIEVSANTGAVTDPDGGNNADIIQERTTGTMHFAREYVPFDKGEVYTYTCDAKMAARRYLRLEVYPDVSYVCTAIFDLQTGVAGAISPLWSVSSEITALGDDWYRCEHVFTAGPTFSRSSVFVTVGGASGERTFAGTDQDAFYVHNATLRRGTALAYATALRTLVIDAVESIGSTRVEFSLSSVAEGASRLPDVLVGPPLCNHIPPAGTVIKWGSTSITLERE